jgi:hypothetical protein
MVTAHLWPPRGRTALVAVLVCWLFVVFDGCDLIVYGNVIPSLQRGGGSAPPRRARWAAWHSSG